MKRWITLTALAFAAGGACAQAFDLKGYAVGAPMADCPEETIKRGGKAPEIECHLGPTTLANAPVEHVILSIYEGKLVSVLFFLSKKGQYANGEVRDALMEKFGRPTSTKAHINEYNWLRPGQHLAMNGWQGHIYLYDTEATQRMKTERQQTNKKDL
jgi:hypothetical protein